MTTPTHASTPSHTHASTHAHPAHAERSFAQDVAFLRKHRSTIVLRAPAGDGQAAVVPAFQGRVMTSSARGEHGQSFGFIKDDLVASSTILPHINPYGGEDRFWIGPEGGQFSIFFPPGGAEQTLRDWQTPPALDIEGFTVTGQTASSVTLAHQATFINASGARFEVRIDREISLLDPAAALADLGAPKAAGPLHAVAFESRNSITNIGAAPWTRETGLLSIWILGMFKHGPHTAVAVPLHATRHSNLAELINDRYFGKVPTDRLKLVERGPIHADPSPGLMLLFKGDGQHRAKIGVAPGAALPIAASYDPSPSRRVLTLCSYSIPAGPRQDYVNSMWQARQSDPYAGDVFNSYNDGPSEPGGKPFGPFYELESSSPAAALAPGQSITHAHRTIHVEAAHIETAPAELSPITQALLGVPLAALASAF